MLSHPSERLIQGAHGRLLCVGLTVQQSSIPPQETWPPGYMLLSPCFCFTISLLGFMDKGAHPALCLFLVFPLCVNNEGTETSDSSTESLYINSNNNKLWGAFSFASVSNRMCQHFILCLLMFILNCIVWLLVWTVIGQNNKKNWQHLLVIVNDIQNINILSWLYEQ